MRDRGRRGLTQARPAHLQSDALGDAFRDVPPTARDQLRFAFFAGFGFAAFFFGGFFLNGLCGAGGIARARFSASSRFFSSEVVMRQFLIPNNHSTLKEQPEIARLLGVYVSTFARIELATVHLFCTLTGANVDAAHVITHQLLNFSGRIALLEDLIAAFEPPAMQEEIKALVADIKAENTKRNILAHGIYAFTEKGDLIVVSNATKVRAKPKVYPADSSELAARCAHAETLLLRLSAFEAAKIA